MIYPYICSNCEKKFDVVKPVVDCANAESCPDCGKKAVRVYTPFRINMGDIYSGYNPALGCHIKNKGDLNARLREHKDRTGIELVETGNERVKAKPVSSYELTAEEKKKIPEILQSVEG